MPTLTEVAVLFDKCTGLEPASRDAFLGSIPDRRVSVLLRDLLRADKKAERTGFLGPHPH